MQYLAPRPNRLNGNLLDFPRSVEDLFHRFWGGMPRATADLFTPAVDFVETPQAYVLRVEIPGVDPANVEVTLVGDTLTIRGEKHVEDKEEGQTWCVTERIGGRFERTFRLPLPASSKDIEAEARHGVLEIRVAKAPEAQPRKITVRKA
jgi:HSP20 family protein